MRKHLSWLLAILLVVTMTSQAAAAYVMACQGTPACCCDAPTPDMGKNAMPGGMDQNCCTTTSAEPCDIATTSHAVAEPFLSGFVTSSVDADMAAGIIAIIDDSGGAALHMARHCENIADRGGPPIYLQIQTFLC